MKSADDPERLLDGAADGLPELRLGLERMSGELPEAERLARMAARLGISPPAAPKPAESDAPLQPLAAKLAKIAGVAVIAGGIGFAVHGARESQRGENRGATSHASVSSQRLPEVAPVRAGARATGSSVPRRTTSESSPSAPGAPSVATEKPSTEPIPPSPARPDDVRSGTGRPSEPDARSDSSTRVPSGSEKRPSPTSQTGSPLARPPAAGVPTETDLLRDARLVLDRSPAEALALTERHRREYPNGAFSQEREVIAITALARLGRTSDARGRAERFRTLYPSSPYNARIDALVPP
jgi:hypothetical protein